MEHSQDDSRIPARFPPCDAASLSCSKPDCAGMDGAPVSSNDRRRMIVLLSAKMQGFFKQVGS